MQVPTLDDLPLYISKSEAGVTLLKAVRTKVSSSPGVRQVSQLLEIARPFAQDMNLLKPFLTREFNQYVPFRVSFTLTVVFFIVVTVLRLVFMYVYHRFDLRDRIFPKSPTNDNTIRPVLQLSKECPLNLSQKVSKRYHLIFHNAIESSETPPEEHQKAPLADLLQAASSSSAASESSYANALRFVSTDTTLERENVYVSIDKNLNTATTAVWST